MEAAIGIIGGTGVGLLDLQDRREVKVHTPYGAPSDAITLGTLDGRAVAVLPRHGSGHTIPPGRINARANIWALKELGVTRILAPSAVGSLQERIAPGDIVLVDQFIDRTSGRKSTFYERGKVCHISVAEPFCPELRNFLIKTSEEFRFPSQKAGTYVCIEGPRFSTKAESRLYRSWGADVIGMTLVPECVLAREAELCYSSIAMVTDYDTFKEDKTVSIEEILKTMKQNGEKVKKLIMEVIAKIPEKKGMPLQRCIEGSCDLNKKHIV